MPTLSNRLGSPNTKDSSVLGSIVGSLDMSYSLNSYRGVIGDYIGDYYRVY